MGIKWLRFSNIGKVNVDVFAPGVKIMQRPREHLYKYLQGTSMASPNVAGVAAVHVLITQTLSASQINILMDSGVNLYSVV
jgi:subtilisin family serine protease